MPVVVVLSALLAAVAGYLVLVLRQVRSVTYQLERRATGDTHTAVTLDLLNGDLEGLAARINDTVRQAETATARTRQDEKRFRSLITDISHDLRTPLTAVGGYHQLLERSDLDADQRVKLAVARRHVAELATLVERLYEYTYLLEVEPHLDAEELDAGVVVGECLLAATTPLEGAGLDVRFDPAGPVPIVTDREKLTRIVQNLIRNAVQHGHDVLDVAVTAGSGDVRIAFTNPVEPGSPIDTDRVFDRFYTGDASRTGRTTGLGLSIVQVLSEQLGGGAAATVDDGRLVLTVRIPATRRLACT